MLALTTGWTQRTISGETGEVSDDFRAGCHWALYAQTVAPILDDHEQRAVTPLPPDIDNKTMAVLGRARVDARRAVETIHWLLYPEDPDGGA